MAYILYSLKDSARIHYNRDGQGLEEFGHLAEEPTIVLNLATVFERVRNATEE